MKRLISLLICLLMLTALAACGGGKEPGEAKPTEGAEYGESFETGLLYVTLFSKEHEVTALTLSGNRAGDKINGVEPCVQGFRSAFEINEWVEYRLVCGEGESGRCTAFVCPHRDFSQYKKADLNDLSVYIDSVEFEGEAAGSFYVPAEEPEGYYDVLFTFSGKIAAYTVIRVYPEGSLEDKTDAELEALREEVIINK
jgi:hypothetical protein